MDEEDDRKWTNIMFDSQVLNTFMGCPREMKFRFVDRAAEALMLKII